MVPCAHQQRHREHHFLTTTISSTAVKCVLEKKDRDENVSSLPNMYKVNKKSESLYALI